MVSWGDQGIPLESDDIVDWGGQGIPLESDDMVNWRGQGIPLESANGRISQHNNKMNWHVCICYIWTGLINYFLIWTASWDLQLASIGHARNTLNSKPTTKQSSASMCQFGS